MILKGIKLGFSSLNPFQRSVVSAFAGLIGYGTWAYLVNSMHGMDVAFKAACVQGSYSFALTFIMTLMIEALYRIMVGVLGVTPSAKVATIVLTCATLFSSSWWINAMAETPEIFSTVILGYIIGAIYTTTYVVGLAQGKNPTEQETTDPLRTHLLKRDPLKRT